ncbi:hypothetical protein [Cedecea sp. FDAARGOS_727]|nr:hypothetical protein [Cedecea sp. FDAARGOS_727]
MANKDITTTANSPLGFQPVIEPVLSAVLKAQLGTGHDLFQVLDA